MVHMWEEAPRITIFGTEVYQFGMYCMIGAVCAVLAMLILCRHEKLKSGTGSLLSLLSVLFGLLFSRMFYSILFLISNAGFPLSAWPQITTGGWSLFGMVFGVFAASWLTAKIMGIKAAVTADIVSCGLPLLIAAARYGEKLFEGFDVSRPLTEKAFPSGTFLAVRDLYYEDTSYLATWLLAAVLAIVLFLVLVLSLVREGRRDGDMQILFLLLCGAGGILLESLRYDHFLEFSFVRFEQVMAALLLAWGVFSAAARNRAAKPLRASAFVSIPMVVGAVIGIEFALDRSAVSHYLLYAIMAILLAVPVTLSILLLAKREKETA